jgi:sigma-E factor negative regulatory protein RseB
MKCLGLLLFLLCLATPFAYADQAGWSVIEDAYKASQNKNYKGIYISQHGQELKSVEITHALHGNEQFTRINLLDGNADEIFSQGDTAVIYHKRDNTIVVQKREQQHLFPAIFPKDINSIKKYYLLSFGKPDRVAGRITQNIVLTPKDDLRYAYHFWLDQQTSLPMKMIVQNLKKEVLEQSAFNKIQFVSSMGLDWFNPTVDLSKEYLMDDGLSKEINLNRFWKASNIPPGFKEVNFIASKMPGINMMSYHTVYSDGLSYISLFLQPVRKGQKPKTGDLNFDATNVAARYYNGYQIMAVGAVPLKAVRNLIDSVDF